MPNWCTIEMSISKDAKKILDFIKGDGTLFDFNKVIPMPPDQPDLSKLNPFLAHSNIGIKEHGLFGNNNWFDWSVINWGTKWNACNTVLITSNTIEFRTAWDAPIPVIIALSKLFPETKFGLTVEYEGGYPTHRGTIKNGVITSKRGLY